MKKIVLSSFFIMICLVVISIFFALKEKFLEAKIIKLNKEIYNSYGEVQSLKAEWNYLNNKEYLKMMADKYLPDLVVQQKIKNTEEIIKKLP